jgi:lantibiotic modifying enzyme
VGNDSAGLFLQMYLTLLTGHEELVDRISLISLCQSRVVNEIKSREAAMVD